MSEKPLVSVIIPSYNHEQYIEEAVRSVWEQTYRPIELIVVDDASVDQSVKILTEMRRMSPIPMRILTHHRNCGISKTLNDGIKASTGDYIVIFASDDWIPPHRVSAHVMFMLEHPEVDIVWGDMSLYCPDGSTRYMDLSIENLSLLDFLRSKKIFYIQAATFKRHILEEEEFDETLGIEDFDMSLRLLKRLESGEIVMQYIPGLAIFRRVHPYQTSNQYAFLRRELKKVFQKHLKDVESIGVPKRWYWYKWTLHDSFFAYWSNPSRLRSFHFLRPAIYAPDRLVDVIYRFAIYFLKCPKKRFC